MMSFRVLRSCRRTSSSCFRGSCDSDCGSGREPSGMAAKDTLPRRNEDGVAGPVIDEGAVRVDAAGQRLDSYSTVEHPLGDRKLPQLKREKIELPRTERRSVRGKKRHADQRTQRGQEA